jgi:hypothetical protein
LEGCNSWSKSIHTQPLQFLFLISRQRAASFLVAPRWEETKKSCWAGGRAWPGGRGAKVSQGCPSMSWCLCWPSVRGCTCTTRRMMNAQLLRTVHAVHTYVPYCLVPVLDAHWRSEKGRNEC